MDLLDTKIRKILALTAALAYLTFLVLYMLPASPLRDAVLSPMLLPAKFLGLEEKWNVYPTLPNSNTRVYAYVTYADGSSIIVELWEPDRMEPSQRFRYQKIIKLFHTYATKPASDLIWRDICKYVVRTHKFSMTTNPVTVALILRWSQIPPPDKFVKTADVPPRTSSLTLCTYHVQPEDIVL